MKALLIYRPELSEDPSDPFDGIELYGVYSDDMDVDDSVVKPLHNFHPDWKFYTTSPEEVVLE